MTSRGVLPGLLSSFGLLVLAFPRARGFGRVPSFCGPIRLASAWGSGAPVLSVAGFRGAVATRGESLGVVLHVCAGQGGGAADCTGGPSAALGRALKGALAPALPLPAVTPARACPRPGVTLRVWVHPVRQLVARPGEVGPYWVGPAQGSDCTGFGLRGFRLRGCGCVSIRAAWSADPPDGGPVACRVRAIRGGAAGCAVGLGGGSIHLGGMNSGRPLLVRASHSEWWIMR